MTLDEMHARVEKYLDRSELDTDIVNWINDTRRDVAQKYTFNYLYSEATASTTAGSARYSLPSDYLGHLTIFCGNKKLARVAAREMDELTGTDSEEQVTRYALPTEDSVDDSNQGAPDYYIDRGMEFDLYPVPNATFTLTLRYYVLPESFHTSTSSGTQEDYMCRFHPEVIIFGAALRGAAYLDDEVKIGIFKDAYANAFQDMLTKEKESKAADKHPRVKTYKDFDIQTFKRIMRINT